MNDNEEDLDSTIRHAKALTWVCVALFVVLDVIGLTAPSQSDPRFVLGPLVGPRPSWVSLARVSGGPPWPPSGGPVPWTTVSIVNSTSRTMPGAMTGVSRRPSSLSP